MQKVIKNTQSVQDSETLLVGNWAGSMLSTDRLIDLDSLGIEVEGLPEKTKKLLRQPVLPRSVLHAFQALNKRAVDRTFTFSVRSPLGRVMHPDRGGEFIEIMKEVEKDWASALAELAPNFESITQKVLEEVAEAEYASEEQRAAVLEAVKEVQPDWAAFQASVHFRWTLSAVAAIGEFDVSIHEAIRNSLVAVRDGAYAELIREISVEARDVLKLIAGKDGVHPRTVARVGALADKMDALAFLGRGVDVAANEIRAFLRLMPQTTSLKGSDYDNFETLLMALIDQRVIFNKLAEGIPLIEVVGKTPDLFHSEEAAPTVAPTATPANTVPAMAGLASMSGSDVETVSEEAPASSVVEGDGHANSVAQLAVPAATAEFGGFHLVDTNAQSPDNDLAALGFAVSSSASAVSNDDLEALGFSVSK